ncbi:MAG: cytochrome D1 domain-containing protein [Candidatus Bipolaricaulia bacterium]
MRRNRSIAILILTLMASLLAYLADRGMPETRVRREVEILFQEECAACHGDRRQGGLGPALIPQRLATRGDEELKQIILNGIPGTAMPVWLDVLTRENVEELVRFIKEVPPSPEALRWGMMDIWGSFEVLIFDEELPEQPAYEIRSIEDLMVVTERDVGHLFFVDGHENRFLGRILDAGYKTNTIVYDPTDERWLYLIARNGWVYKVDLYTLQPVRKVRVGIDSRGLAISADGRYLMAGNYIPNSAVVLTAETLEPLKLIRTFGVDPDGEAVESRVNYVAYTPAGRGRFVLVLEEAGQVWLVEPSANFPIVATIEQVGRTLQGGLLTSAGRQLVVASQGDDRLVAIDLEAEQIVDRVLTGRHPYLNAEAIVRSDDRTLVFTPSIGSDYLTVWDLDTFEVVRRIEMGGPSLFVAAHPESPYVWADVALGPNNDRIQVIDKQSLEVVRTLRPGMRSVHPEFTADGRHVYVSIWGEDRVVVYDADTFEVIVEFTRVRTPTGIFSARVRQISRLTGI